KKDATDKNLVTVGRITSLVALIIAAIAVKPLLGGLDQAFQYIQEYSGFIYPGIVCVFGMGLLWKRASAKAAVWTAIATIPLGVLFKLTMPHVAFQLRAGYIFMILLAMMVINSLNDKNFVKSEPLSEKDQATMVKWGKRLGYTGIFFIVLALIVTIWYKCLPATATPDNNFIAYLNDIGFQAFFFFGVLVGMHAIWLIGNAKDDKEDEKALRTDLSAFHTTKGYNIGGLCILAIIVFLYIVLW
ncbi:MAG: sodium/glucose cotransporter, partial [Bacteroidales bacterium]|nr:sodium/glucose cotransporter [Bacteroidales bacterium]